MSSSARPALPRNNSTPIKQTTSQEQPVKESPGNWRHPRLAEITRRQSKNVFSETNIRNIVYNVGALAVLEVTRSLILPVVLPYWPDQLLGRELRTHAFWIFLGLALIPLLNIGVALLPLVRPRDDMPDIPLTPGQRKLLGLPSTGRPAAASSSTPNSVYSTPPRYSRTPSLAGSPVSIKSYGGSPLSNRGSPSESTRRQQSSNSPYNSPSGASPLLQKAVAGGNGGAAGRRSSFGSPSPLGVSTASSVFGDGPATPTPAGSGKRSSVSLNNKWLYEKGRRSSSNSWLHQGL
ncbi:nuclear pore complex component-domain-containing protein [Podospora appendiculata]|uniref:Nuclear pore complex component-domain-containing protein n=1 Tax=Podospora appendiculata TaxID=314037 RepID=A0AAE0X462_9PEZI|nr:nuclear pore complex component-domain-containing protein [Podospora appendiculata]